VTLLGDLCVGPKHSCRLRGPRVWAGGSFGWNFDDYVNLIGGESEPVGLRVGESPQVWTYLQLSTFLICTRLMGSMGGGEGGVKLSLRSTGIGLHIPVP
jgi:hypothetical protein